MRLIHRSPRAANAVRTVSPGGELFVASVVICMLLASFGDAVDPTLFGEAGLEFALFDFGGEFTVLALRHWHLVQLLFAGGLVEELDEAFSADATSGQLVVGPGHYRNTDEYLGGMPIVDVADDAA